MLMMGELGAGMDADSFSSLATAERRDVPLMARCGAFLVLCIGAAAYPVVTSSLLPHSLLVL